MANEYESFMKQQQKLLRKAFSILQDILIEKISVPEAKDIYKEFLQTEFTDVERNTIRYILMTEKDTPLHTIWLRDLFIELLDSKASEKM